MAPPESIDIKYRIGIDEMDAQHAQWIRLIERFRAAASGHLRDQASVDAAREALQALLEYTKNHFASEESLMAAHRYPNLDAHRKAHEELQAGVKKLLAELNEKPTAPLKLNLFITIWMMEHIMQEDKKYALFILGQRDAVQ